MLPEVVVGTQWNSFRYGGELLDTYVARCAKRYYDGANVAARDPGELQASTTDN